MSEETTYIHAVTETYGREHHTEGQDKTLEEELLVEIHKESQHGEDNEAEKYFFVFDESMLNEFLGTKSKDSTQKEKGGFKIP